MAQASRFKIETTNVKCTASAIFSPAQQSLESLTGSHHALVESPVTPPQPGNASCFPENVIGPRQTLMKNPCKNTQKTLWMLQAFQEFLLCDRLPHSRSVTCTLYTTSGKASPQPLSVSILRIILLLFQRSIKGDSAIQIAGGPILRLSQGNQKKLLCFE